MARASSARWCLTSRSSSTSRRARPTPRFTCPPPGATAIAGEFDQGWDTLREEIFARQKQLGIVPPDCELTARPDGIPAWSDVPDDMKPVLTRQMELYAAFLEHTDHCIGQVIDGDRGARGAGRHADLRHHRRQRRVGRRHAQRDVERVADDDRHGSTSKHRSSSRERLESFGTPESYPQYSLGWGHAMNTPYQWTKRIASHWGGTRNGLIVHWPRGIDGPRRVATSIPPRDRRRADVARSRAAAAAGSGQRRHAAADRRRSMLYSFDQRRCAGPS